MAAVAPPVDSRTAPAPPKKGLWDSLSPSEQKKAVTVFLCSLGVTLLVTGRSGGKLLKRAKAGEASAAPATTPANHVKTRRRAVEAIPRRPEPAPLPPAAVRPVRAVETAQTTETDASRPTRKRPQPPPVSILHPNSLTPPKPRRRLLASFISAPVSRDDQRVSVLPLSSRPPPPSSYFLPNPTLVATSNAFAQELDKLDKLHEDGADEPVAPAADDGFNPAVFAMKALGIATLLSVGTFAVGIYGVMRYLGVDDVRRLSVSLCARTCSVCFLCMLTSGSLWCTANSRNRSRWRCSTGCRPCLTRTGQPCPTGRLPSRLLLLQEEPRDLQQQRRTRPSRRKS